MWYKLKHVVTEKYKDAAGLILKRWFIIQSVKSKHINFSSKITLLDTRWAASFKTDLHSIHLSVLLYFSPDSPAGPWGSCFLVGWCPTPWRSPSLRCTRDELRCWWWRHTPPLRGSGCGSDGRDEGFPDPAERREERARAASGRPRSRGTNRRWEGIERGGKINQYSQAERATAKKQTKIGLLGAMKTRERRWKSINQLASK